jgi:ketosteroid isomerase-like protein
VTQVSIVQAIYEAFGRGDFPAILVHLAEDVEWEYGVNSTDVPWLQRRRGRSAVPAFFEALGALDIQAFDVRALLAADNVVLALTGLDATVRATGIRIVEDDEVHTWYFNEANEVVRFRHRIDTHQQWKAYHGHSD